MSTPIAYDYRMKIVRMRKRGKTYKAICESVPCSIPSAKRIWRRFKEEGEAGLATKYHQSGRKGSFEASVREKIAEIRDNEQGAPYVRSVLFEKYPELAIIPHERTIQRWWKAEGVNRSKGRPKSRSEWTDEPGHTLQIDGKSHVRLENEQEVSWMNVADEATGCDLDARLFPLC